VFVCRQCKALNATTKVAQAVGTLLGILILGSPKQQLIVQVVDDSPITLWWARTEVIQSKTIKSVFASISVRLASSLSISWEKIFNSLLALMRPGTSMATANFQCPWAKRGSIAKMLGSTPLWELIE